MISKIGWEGKWIIRVIDKPSRHITREDVIHNRIMNAALDELIKAWYNPPPDMGIAYFAIGDDSTPVSDSQTTLINEVFRCQFISILRSGIGEVTSIAILLDTDYTGMIEEIGIFGGSSASGAADTGLLISRILWSHNKTGTEEIQFTRVDKVVRA